MMPVWQVDQRITLDVRVNNLDRIKGSEQILSQLNVYGFKLGELPDCYAYILRILYIYIT